ncbi:MAG: hypothetical protein J7K22_04335 [Nanoarchaeota archaeon]|nr:hypothetical protein [Nanoarchaeota archaeon]
MGVLVDTDGGLFRQPKLKILVTDVNTSRLEQILSKLKFKKSYFGDYVIFKKRFLPFDFLYEQTVVINHNSRSATLELSCYGATILIKEFKGVFDRDIYNTLATKVNDVYRRYWDF